jgi:hypothetical protein
MSSKSTCSCFTWLVRISPLVVPIRKACLTCPVLLYEGVNHVSRITFLTNKFQGTVNIKINIFTSFHCLYGLQTNRFCMRISKSTEKHWSHSNCSPVLFVTLFHCLLFLLWTCDIMIKHIITAYNRVYFLQNKSLIIVHVFRGVKYCLNIFHRRWIILEFLINTWMFDVYHLSTCKPHVYYLYTTCTLPVNCRHRFKQEMMYSVQKSHEQNT